MSNAYIHLRVPAATKASWVAHSRAAGMRLTDFITAAVEAYVTELTKIAIPKDLPFSALNLQRDADGHISFDIGVIKQICDASGLPLAMFTESPEDNLAQLVMAWYARHRESGGDPDPVVEDLIAEVIAEDSAGQRYSHKPGSA